MAEMMGTFEYDCDLNSSDPIERHRVLIYRHGSARRWVRHLEDLESIKRQHRGEEMGYIAALLNLVSQGLVGWRGFDVEYAEGTGLDEVLRMIEIEHLAETLPIVARSAEYQEYADRLRALKPNHSGDAAPAGSTNCRPGAAHH